MAKHKLTVPQGRGFIQKCKFPLLSGGLGSGKSEVLHLKAITQFINYPGIDIAIYSASYDLLLLNNIPRMELLLKEHDIRYTFNKKEMTINCRGYGKMIFRSMLVPERIIAYEIALSFVDELDTLSRDKAELAWNKIIGRNRQVYTDVVGSPLSDLIELTQAQKKLYPDKTHMLQNKVSVYTTPEGFNFTYFQWKKSTNPDYGYVQMATSSNPHLPGDYEQGIRDTYPKALADAHLAGEWVNLTSGSVYGSYDRELHRTDAAVKNMEPLIVGMDFNVGRSAAVFFALRKGVLHAVDEIHKAFDTRELIAITKERYEHNSISLYPDLTGRARKSVNATESDHILLKNAGFSVREKGVNPPIKTRVMSVNAAFEHGKLLVNPEACPNLADMLEQQVYDKNGMPKKDGLEDINDAFGYPVERLFRIRRNVRYDKPRQRKFVGSN